MALDVIQIEGGQPLVGEVEIGGAKNAALPVLALTLLTQERCQLHHVPQLEDVRSMLHILQTFGADVQVSGHDAVVVTKNIEHAQAPYDFVRKMRASVLLLGPLLARFHRARVSLPGGCAIGVRPINLHLKALAALGADLKLEGGYVDALAERLKGARFHFDAITVTGTINAIMAASLAEGESEFYNCALEPEVVQVCNVLTSMGVVIEGQGTHTIRIQGQTQLKGFDATLIPDRIEAGTYMVASAITQGDLVLRHVEETHMRAVINRLRDIGIEVTSTDAGLRVRGGDIKPISLQTSPFPGFPTDMQAQFVSLLSLASGTSVVKETIFENRFMHVPELIRMGADLQIDGHSITIRGVKQLSGAPVMATDLRASASLVLAGLAAQGTTDVLRIYHLDRGYEKMEVKLSKVGARISRIKSLT